MTLTHWGRVTHICVIILTIIGSDNGLSPGRRQAIIWTNDGILLIEPLGSNFSEILFGIQTYSFNKMHLKMSSAKWRPFWLGLDVLIMYTWPGALFSNMDSAVAKRSPNATNKTVGRSRYYQLQVRLTSREFILPRSLSNCVVIKIYLFFNILISDNPKLVRTIQRTKWVVRWDLSSPAALYGLTKIPDG